MTQLSNARNLDIREKERGRRYLIRFYIPPNKKIPKWHWSPAKTVYGNKKQAEAEAIKYQNEYYGKPNDDIETLDEYIIDYENTRFNVKDSTIERDKAINSRISKYLGEYKLTDLNKKLITRAYKQLQNNGDSMNILHKVHTKLKKILQKAEYENRIDKNPCNLISGITRPKPNNQDQLYSDKQFDILKKELKNRKPNGNLCVIKLALSTGMRKGEILGLLWENIDLKNKIIKIKYQLDKNNELVHPKTDSSKRSIPISSDLSNYLKKWKQIQKEQFKNTGVSINNKTPVCTNELGKFINPDNFGRWRRKFYYDIKIATYEKIDEYIDSNGVKRKKYCGYKGPNLHALRKKYGEILVSENIDPKTVQALLGHEKISTTLEIYARAVPRNAPKAINKISKKLS